MNYLELETNPNLRLLVPRLVWLANTVRDFLEGRATEDQLIAQLAKLDETRAALRKDAAQVIEEELS